ncbi:hypothetical protein ABKN59_009372 [Abortiporus biennis]
MIDIPFNSSRLAQALPMSLSLCINVRASFGLRLAHKAQDDVYFPPLLPLSHRCLSWKYFSERGTQLEKFIIQQREQLSSCRFSCV